MAFSFRWNRLHAYLSFPFPLLRLKSVHHHGAFLKLLRQWRFSVELAQQRIYGLLCQNRLLNHEIRLYFLRNYPGSTLWSGRNYRLALGKLVWNLIQVQVHHACFDSDMYLGTFLPVLGTLPLNTGQLLSSLLFIHNLFKLLFAVFQRVEDFVIFRPWRNSLWRHRFEISTIWFFVGQLV